MKKKLIIILLTLITLNNLYIFSEDLNCIIPASGTQYIYEKRVNLRSSPSINSDKTGLALLGEKVTIIETTDKYDTLYGITALWYKIKWKNEECYIWGGLLSTMGAEDDLDNDGKKEQLIGQTKTSKLYMHTDDYFWASLESIDTVEELKLCRNNTIVNNAPLQCPVQGKYDYIQIIKDLQFKPDIPIILLGYKIGEGGGGMHEYCIYFLKNNSLSFISKINEQYSGPDSETAQITYPKDHNLDNVLKIELIESKYDSETDSYNKKIKNTENWKWNGNKFVPID